MSAPTQAASSSARLLLVDDNPENLDLLQRRLERRGFETVCVTSGEAALTRLDEESFSAVLLDIQMPGMSGLEALERLRQRFSKIELPVIMATARSGSDVMVEALKLGANDYVTKPLEFPVVLARLEMHLAVSREASEAASEAAPASAPALRMGRLLPEGLEVDGSYRIEGVLGEGGFAVVYRATQLSTGQQVALKLLRPERLTEDEASTERARFELEMRIIGRSEHPALVRLIDSGKLRLQLGEAASVLEVPFLVMELLTGKTLADQIIQGPLTVSDAIELLLPVLDGVHTLHEEGVLHRDLKPANIFLHEEDGGGVRPRVLDFGLAKLTESNDALSRTALLGTAHYVSPEQIRGARLDHRADQHALGAVFYEMLSGKLPYQGDTDAAVITAIASGKMTPIVKHLPWLPEPVQVAVFQALSPNRVLRFESLLHFAEALLPFATDEVQAEWRRRHGPGSQKRFDPLSLDRTIRQPS